MNSENVQTSCITNIKRNTVFFITNKQKRETINLMGAGRIRTTGEMAVLVAMRTMRLMQDGSGENQNNWWK